MREFNLEDISMMRRITIRDLGRRVADLFDRIDTEGPVLVTRNGRPVAVLSSITDPALRRKRALQPVTEAERGGLPWSTFAPERAGTMQQPAGKRAVKQEDAPLPDFELDDVRRTVLAEIAWFGGRKWFLNDDDPNVDIRLMMSTLGFMQIAGLIDGHSSWASLTRLGARFVEERIGAQFVEEAGRAMRYGFPPERLGHGPATGPGPSIEAAS